MDQEAMTEDGWTMIPNEGEGGDEVITHIAVERDKPVLMLRRHGHIWFKFVDPMEAACGSVRNNPNVFVVIEIDPWED